EPPEREQRAVVVVVVDRRAEGVGHPLATRRLVDGLVFDEIEREETVSRLPERLLPRTSGEHRSADGCDPLGRWTDRLDRDPQVAAPRARRPGGRGGRRSGLLG